MLRNPLNTLNEQKEIFEKRKIVINEEITQTERIQKEIKRITNKEIENIINFNEEEINYENIIKEIFNKSNLLFIIEYEQNEEDKKYTICIEEKLYGYDNCITHLNSNSFIIIDNNNDNKKSFKGILIGSKENDILLSFKHKDDKEKEIKINKKGEIINSSFFGDEKSKVKRITVVKMKEENKKRNQRKTNSFLR